MACCRTKATISLKRVKIEEKLLRTAYRNSPTLFRMVPSLTHYGLPFPKIGGLQLSYPLSSQEQVKIRTSNLTSTFTGPIQVKTIQNLRENGAWAYQGTAQIFWVPPIISGTAKATDFKFGGYIGLYGAYPNKSPLKVLENRERGRIQGLPKFFGYPLLSQERVKLRTSNFVGTFIGSIGTKAHESVGNSAVGVVKESRKFSGHP